MKKTILVFGGISIAILLLLQISKWSMWSFGSSGFHWVFIVGPAFLVLGFVLAKLFRRPSIGAYRPVQLPKNEVNLSSQEFKVLSLMAEGLSNLEIAESLYITESTVKTHVSNVLSKLNARRRTEAVKIGRTLKIIP